MTAEATPVTTSAQIRSRTWTTYLIGAIALLYVAFVLVYRLGEYPLPWFDEGSYLKVAKNYAINGIYADFSSEGNRYTGAVIAAGPTVILPVAAIFKLFGVNLVLARLVIVVYSFLMLGVLYALCANLGSARLAVVTLALVILNPTLDLQVYSREVMGEVPGLFFLFAGLWLWLRPTRHNLAGLFIVGVLFGLAAVSKNQYALFILPSLFLAWMLDLIWYRKQGWRYFVIPGLVGGGVYFAWVFYVLFVLGAQGRDVTGDLQLLRTSSETALFLISPGRNLRNALSLIDDGGYPGLLIAALLAGFVLSRRRDEAGQRWGILYTFLLMSVVTYTFSIGFTRYQIPVLALAAPLIAHLLYQLTDGFRLQLRELGAAFRSGELSLSKTAGILVIGLSVLLFIRPGITRFLFSANSGDDSFARLGQYINKNIPSNALIETYDEEIAVLSNHPYHFPPHSVMVNRVQELVAGKPEAQYDFRNWVKPDYVIIGRFSAEAHVYLPEQLSQYKLVQSIGSYKIYQRQ
jgi:4-amino-4-deoxy-L-arabinose transferase-like glycosyltransferase